VDVQHVQPGHAAYVAKYVGKAADARPDVPWCGKRWTGVVGAVVVILGILREMGR
jgi:hypothetical protein